MPIPDEEEVASKIVDLMRNPLIMSKPPDKIILDNVVGESFRDIRHDVTINPRKEKKTETIRRACYNHYPNANLSLGEVLKVIHVGGPNISQQTETQVNSEFRSNVLDRYNNISQKQVSLQSDEEKMFLESHRLFTTVRQLQPIIPNVVDVRAWPRSFHCGSCGFVFYPRRNELMEVSEGTRRDVTCPRCGTTDAAQQIQIVFGCPQCSNEIEFCELFKCARDIQRDCKNARGCNPHDRLSLQRIGTGVWGYRLTCNKNPQLSKPLIAYCYNCGQDVRMQPYTATSRLTIPASILINPPKELSEVRAPQWSTIVQNLLTSFSIKSIEFGVIDTVEVVYGYRLKDKNSPEGYNFLIYPLYQLNERFQKDFGLTPLDNPLGLVNITEKASAIKITLDSSKFAGLPPKEVLHSYAHAAKKALSAPGIGFTETSYYYNVDSWSFTLYSTISFSESLFTLEEEKVVGMWLHGLRLIAYNCPRNCDKSCPMCLQLGVGQCMELNNNLNRNMLIKGIA
jgi:hypothetical protein